MNLIKRFHGHTPEGSESEKNDHRPHKAPFWVRHYDIVTNLITFGRTRTVHKRTLALAGLQPGEAVLDIGCGTGVLLLEAEKIVGDGGTIAGLDVEPEMIRQARERAEKNQSRATFDVASIEEIPYPNDTFDVVFSTLMYHHLTETQKSGGFVELARVLKPNGRLVLVDINPSRRSILTSLPGHSRLDQGDYVRQEAVDRMRAAGFSEIEAGPHPSRQLSYAIGWKR